MRKRELFVLRLFLGLILWPNLNKLGEFRENILLVKANFVNATFVVSTSQGGGMLWFANELQCVIETT